MKIPILHQLEKKIRHLRRGEHSYTKSRRYKALFKKFLSDHNYFADNHPPKNIHQPIESDPLVSIIIPCFNQFKYTFKCINSIYHNTQSSVTYEIILVDDYSSDKTKEIESHFPNITVIRNSKNRGFLKNINHAAKHAAGKYLLLLNNDTIVLENWLSSMLDAFQNFEGVGVVGSKLIFPNGMLQEAGGYVTKDQHFGNYGKFKSIFDPRFNYIREVDYVSGACLMIKTELWKDLEGFDEIYLPAYFEDTDLCMRVRQKGHKVIYTPFSNIIHFESISYGMNPTSGKQKQMEKNQITFTTRWKEELNETHVKKDIAESKNYERTGNKPTILYIDDEPPNDYQAGSRLSKIYCDLLSKMGYVVKFLPMHINKSNECYIKDLQAKGIECCYLQDRDGRAHALNTKDQNVYEQWFHERPQIFDLYLLARPSSYDYLKVIKKYQPDAKYYYHPADIHFVRSERKMALLQETSTKKIISTQEDIKEKTKEIFMLENAEKVLHVSSYENNFLKTTYGFNNGAIIPCYFFPHSNQPANNTPRRELMYVGGSHEASNDGIIWFLREIYHKITQKHPDTILNIVGSCKLQKIDQPNVKILGRVSAEELEQLYSSCIPIIPLRYGAGVKGKVLEAMNYQAPFVSTSIGLEGIRDIELAKKAKDTTVEFAAEVCAVIDNPNHQKSEVEACKNIINSYFTEGAAREALQSILN